MNECVNDVYLSQIVRRVGIIKESVKFETKCKRMQENRCEKRNMRARMPRGHIPVIGVDAYWMTTVLMQVINVV